MQSAVHLPRHLPGHGFDFPSSAVVQQKLFALTLQDEEGRRGWKSIGSAAASIRPSLLEAVYGADMVIPGALAAWLPWVMHCNSNAVELFDPLAYL